MPKASRAMSPPNGGGVWGWGCAPFIDSNLTVSLGSIQLSNFFSDRRSDFINFELQIVRSPSADLVISISEIVQIADLVLSIFCLFMVRSPI